MSNQFYRNVVLAGDGVYADIATCYLASQLRSLGINIYRVRSLSPTQQSTTINADHSIHVLNEDLGIDFKELMIKGVIVPKLVNTGSSLEKTIYFESFANLKDDLPVPHYQVMARLIREAIATEWWSASPLVALHNANKFHPDLHRFYRGNIRPYGATINAHAYSEMLNSKSLSIGVKFLDVSNVDVDVNINGQHNLTLRNEADIAPRDAFFIDMTVERKLATSIATSDINMGTESCGFHYVTQPWVGNCVAMGEAAIKLTGVAPANYVEWLYKTLVRFVDFFPCPARQYVLAQEYNRLQKNDNVSIADFFQTYHSLITLNSKDSLPEKLQHRVNLFNESCQLSEDAAGWAYPAYWPALMIAGGITPRHLPRRVQEIPLKYLMDWYNQRLHNIDTIVSRSYSL